MMPPFANTCGMAQFYSPLLNREAVHSVAVTCEWWRLVSANEDDYSLQQHPSPLVPAGHLLKKQLPKDRDALRQVDVLDSLDIESAEL
jgi:hypothetical protein